MSNTSVPVKVNTFADKQTIAAAPINQNFDQLFSGLADVGTANLLNDSVTTAKILDANVTLAKLAAAVVNALCPTGTILDFIGTVKPNDAWLLVTGAGAGLTIGNAASAGTARANADTVTLFTLLYNSFANAEAAVSGGRGASAAADYAANKTIALPDLGGRTTAGLESAASRLTPTFFGAVTGKSGATLGAVGGLESNTLTTAQLAGHDHTIAHEHTITHTHSLSAHTHNIDHTHDMAHTHTAGSNAGVRNDNSNVLVRQIDAAGNVTSASSAANTGSSSVANSTGPSADVTSASSAANTGSSSVANSGFAGSNTAHNNTQPAIIVNKIIKL